MKKKKALQNLTSMLLAFMLVLSCVPALGASASSAPLGYSVADIGSFTPAPSGRVYAPNDVVYLPITFHGETPTYTQFVNDGFAVNVLASEEFGTPIHQYAKLTSSPYGIAIEIKFDEIIVSTAKNIAFHITVELTRDNAVVFSKNNISTDVANKEVDVNAGDKEISLEGGKILNANADVSGLKVNLGEGFSITSDFESGHRAYGCLETEIEDGDTATIAKHPAISKIFYIHTVNLNPTGTPAKINIAGTYYVYGRDLEYIGTTNERLPYSVKYYLATSRFDIAPITSTGGGSSRSSGGGSNRADGTISTTANIKNSTSAKAISNVGANGAVSDKISIEVTTALTATTSGAATVKTVNATTISSTQIKQMAQQAQSAGKELVLYADTTDSKGNVQGRLYIEPQKLASTSKTLNLGVYTQGKEVNAIIALFGKHFSNYIQVVHLTQKDSFGTSIQVSAKLETKNLDTTTLNFYSYNSETNLYSKISNTNYFVDKNGYIHFYTTLAGDIIVTDAPLTK